jgi:C4-dicarboxylate-specific signal transduction histidine kinase
VHTVLRTHEIVILDDASIPNPFSGDGYFRERPTRSVLCLPLMKQATLIGALYLENGLASRVFTPSRATVLTLLSTQAAISLENARLFEEVLVENHDRRRAEDALRDAQAELAHAARLTTLGELAASIAHEINQPLTAIVSNGGAGLRWLNRATPNVDEARDALARIVSDGQRAADVIRGLRSLAKNAETQRAPLDLNQVIRDVLALAQTDVLRHGALLTTRLMLDDQLVIGDRVQLQQLVLNLLLNAVEAMTTIADGAREVIISSALTKDGKVLVSIEDSGPGVDPAIAERIFEPFVTTKPEGLGLGLSICRSIVRAHGGQLWISPRAPHGVVLQFTIPVAT